MIDFLKPQAKLFLKIFNDDKKIRFKYLINEKECRRYCLTSDLIEMVQNNSLQEQNYSINVMNFTDASLEEVKNLTENFKNGRTILDNYPNILGANMTAYIYYNVDDCKKLINCCFKDIKESNSFDDFYNRLDLENCTSKKIINGYQKYVLKNHNKKW